MGVSQMEEDSPVDGVEADEGDGEGDPGDPLDVTGPDTTQCGWSCLGNISSGSRQQVNS